MKTFEERIDKVTSFALRFLCRCNKLIVGVSGGSDSIALLHFLITLKEEHKLDVKIIAAHVNHMLRGEESERDEVFVREFCEKEKIILRVLRENIDKKAKKLKKGLEETSRIVRYNFFENLLKNSPRGGIAVAHTLTDGVETALFNFARGTGIEGLRGIKRNSEKIFRPFIDLTKSDTLNYCRIHNLKFVHDSSNNLLIYKRNIVRHRILPVLSEINQNFESNFSRAFELLSHDSEYLNMEAEKRVKKCRITKNEYNMEGILKEHFSIFSRVIKFIVRDSCSDIRKGKIEISYRIISLIMELINKGSGVVEVTKGIKIKILGNLLKILHTKEPKIVNLPKIKPKLIKDILTEKTEDFIIKVIDCSELAVLSEGVFSKDLDRCFLDYDLLPADCVFRSRQPGDRFEQAGRGVAKTLKKLFNECGVDVSLRGVLGIVACDHRVLWLEKFGASRGFGYERGRTMRVLYIKRRREFC